MQLKNVDTALEEIYKIKKLESIFITDLVQTINGTTHIIPMILISYDGNKTMNLCSRDRYFDIYAKKVTEVYQDEKDNIYEDSLTDPFGLRRKIKIDDHSRKILESKELFHLGKMYAHYEGLDSYQESLFFQKEEVSTLVPILEYHLSRFLEFTDTSFKVDSKISGYRTRYAMNGSLNGLEKFFPFIYTKESDNHYTFCITGILENAPMIVEIFYESDGIRVRISSPQVDLNAEYQYKVLKGVVRRKEDFTLRGLTTHYLNEDLESIENPLPNISNFDYEADLNYFKLPWNGVYGIKTSIEDLNQEECKIEIVGSIIELSDTSFTRRDSYSLQYLRKDTPNRVGESIILEEYASILTGIELQNNPHHYVIETKFLDTNKPSGYYATNLNGKYFYHVVYTEDPIEKALYPNDKAVNHQVVNKKSDLENTSLVKQLVRGV